MKNKHKLKEIVDCQKRGIPKGVYSVCSANEFVIEAAMEKALVEYDDVIIEATANQVNQFGGYTGMKSHNFRDFVFYIAEKIDFPKDKIILGGDHLGPLTWKNDDADTSMLKASELVRSYTLAGFTKIHIDTSMHLGNDDKTRPLDMEIIAKRGAYLCKYVEAAYSELKEKDQDAIRPVYVIGSEVPIPGGIQESERSIHVTKVKDFEETVNIFRDTFMQNGLEDAWNQVIAVVVQPGVEFGDDIVYKYNRENAKDLTNSLKKYQEIVFEGHSSDYQSPVSLREMVEDGIAILKVGPALTYALREALYLLCFIENEILGNRSDINLSNFINTLDDAMMNDPSNWEKYYRGSEDAIKLAKKYSFSDRCRYYLPLPDVMKSISILIKNLTMEKIPLTLISQYLPVQYNKIKTGMLKNSPESIIKDRIINIIDDYYYAIKHNK